MEIFNNNYSQGGVVKSTFYLKYYLSKIEYRITNEFAKTNRIKKFFECRSDFNWT